MLKCGLVCSEPEKFQNPTIYTSQITLHHNRDNCDSIICLQIVFRDKMIGQSTLVMSNKVKVQLFIHQVAVAEWRRRVLPYYRVKLLPTACLSCKTGNSL